MGWSGLIPNTTKRHKRHEMRHDDTICDTATRYATRRHEVRHDRHEVRHERHEMRHERHEMRHDDTRCDTRTRDATRPEKRATVTKSCKKNRTNACR